MILPTVALNAHAALLTVPAEYMVGAAALGMSRWSIIRGIALSAAKTGIAAGIVLAAGRAIGETMAVLMVTGNVVQNAFSVFEPVRTLAANIALEMSYAMNDHRAALFVSGLHSWCSSCCSGALRLGWREVVMAEIIFGSIQ